MADFRLQRLAQVLVRYSLGLKKGDRLAIETGPLAAPLVREVVREALRAGAYPETVISIPGVREIYFQEGSDEQLTYIPEQRRMIIEDYEAQLIIEASENTKGLSGVNPERMAVAQMATRDLMATYLQRTAERS